MSCLQKAANNKQYAGGEDSVLVVNSSVISEPLPIRNENCGVTLTSDNGKPSDRGSNAPNINQGVIGSNASKHTSTDTEEQAAIKAQAAFRGYLVIITIVISL